MGYGVDIKLKNVMFKNEHVSKIIPLLKDYNTRILKPESDWCRFDDRLDSIDEILEDMRFELVIVGEFWHIKEFDSSNLGKHEEVLRIMAPYLEDCEIKFTGEDDAAWKFKVVGGVAQESIYREDF